MTDQSLEKTNQRQYPKFYEKFVPVAIGAIVLIILGMIVFTIGVAFGLV